MGGKLLGAGGGGFMLLFASPEVQPQIRKRLKKLLCVPFRFEDQGSQIIFYAYLTDKFRKFSPYLVTIEPGPDEEIGPHAFPVIVQEGANFSREELASHLEKNGVETRTLFSSMPTQCPGFKFLGHKLGDFPQAEYIGNNGIHIGVHQGLEKEHLDYFLGLVEGFLAKKGLPLRQAQG